MILRIFLLLVSMAALQSAHSQQPKAPQFVTDSLQKYIEQGMADWDIPGLAIVIVKDGKIAWMKGYGVKDIETKEPVDENTVFMIASNSKLFTGTALAHLEYNEQVQLNDKITNFIKDFSLYDTNVTKLVTIRDMLSHRVGTKTFQGDFTFWNADLSRQSIMYRMRTMQPKGNFRQDYGYCNSCYLTASEIVPIVSGKPWEVYVYDSILLPLNMKNSFTLSNGIERHTNVAKPYTSRYTFSNTLLPYDRIDNLGPATSMASNVNDLSRWLMMQLDSGRLDGKQILPWPVLQRTRDVQIITNSRKSVNFPTYFRGYGLGVYVQDYNCRQVYYHTGGAFGFFTNLSFVPEEKLGIAILTNKDNQDFFEALRLQLLDAYLGVPYVNHSKQFLQQHLAYQKREQGEILAWQARAKAASAPASTSMYTGTYSHPTYGKLVITKQNERSLQLDFKSHNNLKATLEFMGNNEWLLTYSHKGYGIFATGFKTEKGKVQSLVVKVTDFIELDDYVFVKEK
ncbi:serine hydrolase [Aridibaculum aurantiacum]|uniref:serine hydrolase n=1 Tax=Aridibaculum aurantiacum TaxID=2810307 RepID=UPI001A95F353|nr:serine hydrolase [Aridibaculum aurantiacum]